MRAFEYISSSVVLSEFGIKYSESNKYFDEDIAKIYIEEAISYLLTADSHKVYVDVLNLNNAGKVKLPSNFKYPIQIAYRDVTPFDERETRASVIEYIERGINESCDLTISLNCNDCEKRPDESYPIELDVTQTILGANPELMIEYNRFLIGYSNYENWKYSSNLHKNFTIIRPTTNYFFNLPKRIQECQIPCIDELIEYEIDNMVLEVNNGSIRKYPYGSLTKYVDKDCTNNRSGQVLISYIGSRIDEDGFMMIPNLSIVFVYLENYLLEAFSKRRYMFEPTQPNRAAWMDMKQEALRSFHKANSELRIPDKDQWEEIMRNIVLKRKADFRTNRSGRYTPDRADYSDYTLSKISTAGRDIAYFNNYGTGYGR